MSKNSAKILGELVIIAVKARHLANPGVGKADPFATFRLANNAKRTRTDKRGGQHPEWDDEVRFQVLDDSTHKTLKVQVYDEDKREHDLIGETIIDLNKVINEGECDDWYELKVMKKKFAGEIFLEMTFYSASAPPRPSKPAGLANEVRQHSEKPPSKASTPPQRPSNYSTPPAPYPPAQGGYPPQNYPPSKPVVSQYYPPGPSVSAPYPPPSNAYPPAAPYPPISSPPSVSPPVSPPSTIAFPTPEPTPAGAYPSYNNGYPPASGYPPNNAYPPHSGGYPQQSAYPPSPYPPGSYSSGYPPS